jgi:hypothetical protein
VARDLGRTRRGARPSTVCILTHQQLKEKEYSELEDETPKLNRWYHLGWVFCSPCSSLYRLTYYKGVLIEWTRDDDGSPKYVKGSRIDERRVPLLRCPVCGRGVRHHPRNNYTRHENERKGSIIRY